MKSFVERCAKTSKYSLEELSAAWECMEAARKAMLAKKAAR